VPNPTQPVERLFPFVLRSKQLVVGRERLAQLAKKLQFVLITHDISENSREEIVRQFRRCPVVQAYTAADIERLFGLRNTKVIGFRKSSLSRSIHRELVSASAEAGDER